MTESDLRASPRPGYGLDIAAVRFDELDIRLLSAIKGHEGLDHRPHVLEIGCGSGTLAREAARAGAIVTAMDLLTVPAHQDDMAQGITFFTASAPNFPAALDQSQFDFLVSQRTLHYLTYPECLASLRWCRQHARPTARLFLGVSGLSSELGKGYAAGGTPVATRSGSLSVAMAKKHDIHRDVCLYSSSELSELVTLCGFLVEDCWVSPFGNVKLIAKTNENQ